MISSSRLLVACLSVSLFATPVLAHSSHTSHTPWYETQTGLLAIAGVLGLTAVLIFGYYFYQKDTSEERPDDIDEE